VNRIRWPIFFLGGLGFWAVFPSLARSDTYSLNHKDQNVTLFNDETSDFGNGSGGLAGDFDGDGRRDLAILFPSAGKVVVLLDVQQGLESTALLKSLIDARIMATSIIDWTVADLNGDKKDDFILLKSTSLLNNSARDSEIQVFWGRGAFPSTLDTPDLRIVGKRAVYGCTPSLAVGDVNGDSFPDIVSALDNGTRAYVFYGRGVFPSPVIDLSVSTPSVTFTRPTGSFAEYKIPVMVADINGDNLNDIVLSFEHAAPGGRTDAGEIDVVWGSTSLPSQWDFGSTPANVRIWGTENNLRYRCVAAADFSGDHKADLILQYPYNNNFLLNGLAVEGQSGVLDLKSGSSNSVVTTPLYMFGSMETFGDFDGDEKIDRFGDFKGNYNSTIGGTLTSDEVAMGPPFPSTPTFVVGSSHTIGGLFMSGDINGDGVSDLWLYGYDPDFYISSYLNTFYIFYGFRPLKNPTLQLQTRDLDSRRIHASLRVDGNPTEMLFSGDITKDIKDHWIPYQPNYDLALTTDQGPKIVGVKFRNGLGRESRVVQQPLSLTVTELRMTAVTNRAGRGKKAAFDCRLPVPARVQARIYDNQGRLVRELVNEDAPAGLLTLEWDGTTVGGELSAPGTYYLTVEMNGRVERRPVLVE
jgi:hypothetical protein